MSGRTSAIRGMFHVRSAAEGAQEEVPERPGAHGSPALIQEIQQRPRALAVQEIRRDLQVAACGGVDHQPIVNSGLTDRDDWYFA